MSARAQPRRSRDSTGSGGFYGAGRRQNQVVRATSNPTTPNSEPYRVYRPGMVLHDIDQLHSPPVLFEDERMESGHEMESGNGMDSTESDQNEEFSFGNLPPSQTSHNSDQSHSPAYNQQPINSTVSFQTPLTSRVPTTGNRQIILMLQQQQSALKEVLDCQKKSNDRQSDMEKEMQDLKVIVDGISSQCSSTDSEVDKKRKRIVTRSLSVSITLWDDPNCMLCFIFSRKRYIQYTQPVLMTRSLNQVNRKNVHHIVYSKMKSVLQVNLRAQ